MAEKKSFVIYENFGMMLNALEPELAGKVVQIMFRYQCGTDEAELVAYDATAYGIFLSAKQQMDRDTEKYLAKCEAGAKGGTAKASNATTKRSKRVAKRSKSVAKDSNDVAKATQYGDWSMDKEKDKETPTEFTNPPVSPLPGGAYCSDPALDDAVNEFIKHRKAMRKPMTDKAVQLFLGRLEKLAPGNVDRQIQLINTAIERGWQTVYEEQNKASPAQQATAARREHLMQIAGGML